MKLPSGRKENSCPGHFGHIELARRVYHCGFMKEVVDCLSSVCFYCSALLADKNDVKFQEALRLKNPQTRLKRMAMLCKGKKQCAFATKEDNEATMEGLAVGSSVPSNPESTVDGAAAMHRRTGCGALLPKFRKDGLGVHADFHPDDPEAGANPGQSLSAERAFRVLSKISDEDALILGFDSRWVRPEWLYFAHIGDSRIYHLPAAGGIRQVSEDHTHVGWLQRQGKLREMQARNHPGRNGLQQVLGGKNQHLSPHFGAIGYEPGDAFLICSDGLVEGLFNSGMELGSLDHC